MSYRYDCLILLLALTIPRADGIRSGFGRKNKRSDPCDLDSVELAIAVPSPFFLFTLEPKVPYASDSIASVNQPYNSLIQLHVEYCSVEQNRAARNNLLLKL